VSRPIIPAALLALVIAAAGHALPAAAQVMTVEAEGQAVDTVQGAASATRRRALEEALYQAAMIGGAEVTGFTALSRSEIVTDQLVVRPASRILDYSILSEVRVSIMAVRPSLVLDPRAPAWLQPVVQDVAAALMEQLGAHRSVDFAGSVGSSAQEVMSSATANPAFDYATLTGMRPLAAGVASNGFGFDTMVEIRAGSTAGGLIEGPEIELELASRLFSGGTEEGAQAVLRRSVRLPGTGTLALMNPISRRDRATVVAELTAGLEAHVDALVRDIVCRPLVGMLAAAGDGTLSLPFGRRHGLTRNHLAYTEGSSTPYTILEIIGIEDSSVRLRPIDRTRDTAALAGAKARFMEVR
jgi:hypothetical protein